MDLARDLLDHLILDQSREKMGRVDDVVIELRPGRPPRVTAIEVGAASLASRVHPVSGRWLRALARWLEVDVTPVRIPLKALRAVGIDVHVEIDRATRGRLMSTERWLARHLLGRREGNQ